MTGFTSMQTARSHLRSRSNSSRSALKSSLPSMQSTGMDFQLMMTLSCQQMNAFMFSPTELTHAVSQHRVRFSLSDSHFNDLLASDSDDFAGFINNEAAVIRDSEVVADQDNLPNLNNAPSFKRYSSFSDNLGGIKLVNNHSVEDVMPIRATARFGFGRPTQRATFQRGEGEEQFNAIKQADEDCQSGFSSWQEEYPPAGIQPSFEESIIEQRPLQLIVAEKTAVQAATHSERRNKQFEKDNESIEVEPVYVKIDLSAQKKRRRQDKQFNDCNNQPAKSPALVAASKSPAKTKPVDTSTKPQPISYKSLSRSPSRVCSVANLLAVKSTTVNSSQSTRSTALKEGSSTDSTLDNQIYKLTADISVLDSMKSDISKSTAAREKSPGYQKPHKQL